MMQQITIEHTEAPPEGRKLALVFSTDGAEFKIDPAERQNFLPQQRYEIETQENEWEHMGRKGKWHKIVKATQVASAPSSAVINGTSQHTSAGEAEFIRSLLVAAIGVGALPFAERELREGAAMLRNIWRAIGE